MWTCSLCGTKTNEGAPHPTMDCASIRYATLQVENQRLLDAEEGWMEAQKQLVGEVRQLREQCQAWVREGRAVIDILNRMTSGNFAHSKGTARCMIGNRIALLELLLIKGPTT